MYLIYNGKNTDNINCNFTSSRTCWDLWLIIDIQKSKKKQDTILELENLNIKYGRIYYGIRRILFRK